jgi:hypothetical protein
MNGVWCEKMSEYCDKHKTVALRRGKYSLYCPECAREETTRRTGRGKMR